MDQQREGEWVDEAAVSGAGKVGEAAVSGAGTVGEAAVSDGVCLLKSVVRTV